MQETFNEKTFWPELDALGEEQVLVRLRVAKQWGDSPNGQKYALVLLWLKSKEDARALAATEKRDAREEKTLAISSEALSIAKEANRIASEDLAAARANARWAMYAAIVATVAALFAAKDQILALLSNA